METEDRFGFAQSRLPWLVGAGAFLVYLVTLNQWVSLGSLHIISNFTDPNAMVPLAGPLHYLLTYPLRWLPPSSQILGLNAFAALCASLTLALLARSVALLPHDRTREQRHREFGEHALLSLPTAWVPPLFAVLICGLQLSFWEHSSAATGEMLDLLCLAYVTRCLLEYRVSEQERWLTRLAFVYGLGTTNSYALIGYLPLFVGALVWIKGVSFFQWPFIRRMVLCGLAGLALYLVLPLLTTFSQASDTSLWSALRLQLAGQKNALQSIPRIIVLLAALTSLLPLVIIGIRWPSSFGDTSAVGNILANVVFFVVYGLFLVAGLLVALDLNWFFSARVLMVRLLQQYGEPGAGVPFLSFYYLGALCIGYFAGYYLLVLSRGEERSYRRVSALSRALNAALLVLLWAIMLATPVALVSRNLPAMRINNGLLLREYALATLRDLPERGSLVFSDNPQMLTLTQTLLNEKAASAAHLLIDTRFLAYPIYQKFLRQRAPTRWPALPLGSEVAGALDPAFLMLEISKTVSSNAAFYLHPSFGYYFEPLYLQPNGSVYRLGVYQTNDIAPPRLPAEAIRQNNQLWAALWPHLGQLIPWVARNITDARTVGRWYSRSLNYWGVELQRAGDLKNAARFFEAAKQLNPDNLNADINLKFNHSLLAGKPTPVEVGRSAEDQFGQKFRTWSSLLNANGPVDEPGYCFTLGQQLLAESLYRQATLQFQRALQLDPGNVAARLWLASTYHAVGLQDLVLETAAAIRADEPAHPLSLENEAELARLESLAQYGKNQPEAAEKTLLRARQRQPRSELLAETLTELYLTTGRPTNALAVTLEQLRATPGNVRALINAAVIDMKLQRYTEADQALAEALAKEPDNIQALLTRSALCIQTRQFTNALPPLDRILELQPGHRPALINRAIALLQNNQLDAAQRDYETLFKQMPGLPSISFGLAEIAYRRKDVPTAIRHYETYLKLVHPGAGDATSTNEIDQVRARLKELKAAR